MLSLFRVKGSRVGITPEPDSDFNLSCGHVLSCTLNNQRILYILSLKTYLVPMIKSSNELVVKELTCSIQLN